MAWAAALVLEARPVWGSAVYIPCSEQFFALAELALERSQIRALPVSLVKVSSLSPSAFPDSSENEIRNPFALYQEKLHGA